MADRDWLASVVKTVLAAPPALGSTRLITVDGPSGSGKSTTAVELVAQFAQVAGAEMVPTDHFATWDDPFGWWPRLEVGVLQPLSRGRAARYLANDWTGDKPTPTVNISFQPPEVLILEGVSAGRRAITGRSTLSCWIELPDPKARLERAVGRDGESSRSYLRRWQEAEHIWFAAQGTKAEADLIRYVD